jgi:hypothetical protein
MSSPRFFLLVVLAAMAAAIAQPELVTPGGPKTGTTRLLEAGAKLLQHNSPLAPMDIHLVGFHPLKDDPGHQMEAHHFCRQVNEDFAQCVLFDGHGREARLNGIEYIVSEQLFNTLPAQERTYWHPHNAEILTGQLVGPGLPAVAEVALMKQKMNSYGKTWHVWMGQDALPLGPAHLAWSFNRDGELRPELLARRDQKLEIDTAEKRRERAELAKLARPQQGVDALAGAFPGAKAVPGVLDAAGGAAGR